MKIEIAFAAIITALAPTASRSAMAPQSGSPTQTLVELAEQATSQNRTVASVAISRLRSKGPEGLKALLEANAEAIRQHKSAVPHADEEAGWMRLKTALDAVGGQCDCYASGLYWYTDFDSAKEAARVSGKPILSLRLLGKLNEEYSCANSRFFRTTLYANAEVSKYLREHFILHWQSVRPVPRITIDFGDGRKIERTITGNSVHYILDPSGGIVDALPGLYGPKSFLQQLQNAERIALVCGSATDDQRPRLLLQYHLECRQATARAWTADLARLGVGPAPLPVATEAVPRELPPTAKVAGQLAFSKRAIEAPLLKSSEPWQEQAPPGRASVSDEMWARIAALHSAEGRLDSAAIHLISSKLPTAIEASRAALSKRLIENPALRVLKNLQRSVAEDTVRNEYMLHARIHDWFVENDVPADLSRFNAKVYSELFLMPESDPWLGLAPAGVFTALPNEGLIQAASTCSGTGSPYAAN